MVFRNFLGNNFFWVGPPPVGNSDLVVFWPVLSGGHLRKFRARAKNRKTQFCGPRGTFGGGNRPPQKFLPKTAHLFFFFRFDRPDPQGREIAKYWGFRPFWPRAAPWHLEKFWVEAEKRDFPELGALLQNKPAAPKVAPENCATFLHFVF